MAFTSLLVSILGALAAIFAAFYANIAATYARKAATRRDLAQVEQNTKQVEHFSNKILSIDTPIDPREKQEDAQKQVEKKASQVQAQQDDPQPQVERKESQVQAQRETPQAQPQRIHISVEGEAMEEIPLELSLTLQDPSIRVSRVETLGKAGKALASSPCKVTDNALVFKSILAPKKVLQWWDGGESTSEGEGRSVLRVYLLLDESGKEVYRDVPVSIVQGLRNVGITSLVVLTITGSI